MGGTLFLLGKVAFSAIAVAVGWQLARQARRGAAMGLHTVALAAICIGGVGLLLLPAADTLGSERLALASDAAVRAAMLLLCFFVGGTFRPGAVGRACAGLCAALLLTTLVWDTNAQRSLLDYDYGQASAHVNQLSALIPFAWSAIESALSWRRTRRQARIGLADPTLAERFLLWSAASSCFVAISLLAMAAGALTASGAEGRADLVHGARGVLYLAIAGLVWRARFASDPRREPAPATD